jgi:hypothetical protein
VNHKKFLIPLLIVIIFGSSINFSLANQNFIINSKQQANGTKVLIYCKQPVEFSAKINNNVITIKFNKAFTTDFSQILKNSSNIITKASHDKKRKTILLSLINNNYKISKFVSDDFIGIDIIDKSLNNVSHTASNEHIKTSIDYLNIIQKKNSAVDNINNSNVDATTNISSNKDLVVDALSIKEAKRMIFPWQTKVAAAVFYRAGYLWIIFNDSQNLNLEKVKTIFNKIASEFTVIPSNNYTILRLKGNDLNNIKSFKSGSSWIIDIMNKPVVPDTIISEYKSPYSKGIFFPVEDILDEPLIINDPIIGDQLQIIPFYGSSTGVDKPRNFIDFKLLATSQGFALLPISDQIRLTIIIPGIEILIPKNNLPLPSAKNNDKHFTKSYDNNYSLLPFNKWSNTTPLEFNKLKHILQNDIINVPKADKNNRRFEFAKFLLGNNYLAEAKAELKYIAMLDKNYANKNEYKFIKGVIDFMLLRYSDASIAFSDINTSKMENDDRLEIQFWQNATQLIIDGKAVGFDFIRFKDRFLKSYINSIYYKFAYLDIEESLKRNDLEHVDELLRTIKIENSKDKKLELYINSNKYYTGLYMKQAGNLDDALKIWQSLADNASDHFNRARSMFAMAKSLYEAKRIKISEAIEKINSARYAWRGDTLELEILNYLGNLYLKEKDYINTLRIWKIIASNFSDKTDILDITSRMSQLFFNIFGKQNQNDLTDLQFIALFYEFRELTPIGKMGDEIVQQLAYKLIRLDLLDRASVLLNHQINFRLSGIERAIMGNKLALVYLLDQKANKTLDILDATEDPNITPELRLERQRIKAQALIALNQNNLALEAIDNDGSDDAIFIKVNIAWDENNWVNVIKLLEPFLNSKLKTEKKFKTQESENVLRLAISYIMLNNKTAVQNVYDKYNKVMDDTSNLQICLDFIAKGEAPLNYTELEKSLGISNIKDFMNNYRKTLISPSITDPIKK